MIKRTICRDSTVRAIPLTIDSRINSVKVVTPVRCSCGSCPTCRHKKQLEWANRLITAFDIHNRSHVNGYICYITFTIADSYYPGSMNTQVAKRLYRWYFANMIKAVRTYVDLKYYCAAEFGDKFGRLHFHGIFFIDYFSDIETFLRLNDIKLGPAHKVFRRKLKEGKRFEGPQNYKERCCQAFFEHFWKYGFVEKATQCNIGSAFYLTKYVSPLKDDKEHDLCPFHRQSLRLGIDLDKLFEMYSKKQFYEKRSFSNGKNYKYTAPRYYRRMILEQLGLYDEYLRDYMEMAFLDLDLLMNCLPYKGVEINSPDSLVIKFDGYLESDIGTNGKELHYLVGRNRYFRDGEEIK